MALALPQLFHAAGVFAELVPALEAELSAALAVDKLTALRLFNPNRAPRAPPITQVAHFGLFPRFGTFAMVGYLGAGGAMQGEAELALWLFDVKKAFAVDNLAAFVKVVFLQKLKGLKLVQFLEGLAAELAVDGQLFGKWLSAALLEAAGRRKIVGLGVDVGE